MVEFLMWNGSDGDVALNFTPAADNLLESAAARTVIYLAYATVFVLGIGGNTGIIFTVYRHRKMRSTVNILVANLAWSDICTGMIATVFTPLNVLHSWPLGNTLCRFLPMLSSSSIFVSSFTSTVIAVDRYLAVHVPHRKPFTFERLLVVLGVIWAVSLAFSLPICLFSKVALNQCVEDWPAHLSATRKYYTWTCFSIQFIVPSMIVLYSYLRIITTLNSRLRHNLKKGWSVLVKKRINRIRATWRINKMLMLMVASFMVCYLPMNVFNIMVEFADFYLLRLGKYLMVVYLTLHWIAMSSTIYNPLLCITLNNDFRPRCLRQPDSESNSEDYKANQTLSVV